MDISAFARLVNITRTARQKPWEQDKDVVSYGLYIDKMGEWLWDRE